MAKVVKRKILVEVGYYDYHFDDLIAANAFAMTAKTHLSDEDSDRLVKMTVNYEVEEQEEEDKEEDQDDKTTD